MEICGIKLVKPQKVSVKMVECVLCVWCCYIMYLFTYLHPVVETF